MGGLPEPYTLVTPYGAASLDETDENAKRFVDFLRTEAGADALSRAGFSAA